MNGFHFIYCMQLWYNTYAIHILIKSHSPHVHFKSSPFFSTKLQLSLRRPRSSRESLLTVTTIALLKHFFIFTCMDQCMLSLVRYDVVCIIVQFTMSIHICFHKDALGSTPSFHTRSLGRELAIGDLFYSKVDI